MLSAVSLVADQDEVAAIAAALAEAPLVAFDTEFLAQDRLVPTLCLVQVAYTALDAEGPPNVALIDPLAVDVSPIVTTLATHACAVVHAGRQDLQLLAARFGVAMPHVVDTQIMAAFAGLGDQVGFATLANELLGTSLGKELQWTDWARRPLSDAQIAYAHADVHHLPAIFAQLAARLDTRITWARAESSLVAADAFAAAQITADTAWQNVGGLRGLDAKALATVAALAAWRHRVATELDRPLGQVLNDKVLVELARHRPSEEAAIRAVKGIAPIARKRAAEILGALIDAPPLDLPAQPRSSAPTNRAQRWAELLLSITQLVAQQTGVAARLLATRADAEEFARTVDEHGLDAARSLPALSTWRHDVLGSVWLGFLTGTYALVGDVNAATGIAIVPIGR